MTLRDAMPTEVITGRRHLLGQRTTNQLSESGCARGEMHCDTGNSGDNLTESPLFVAGEIAGRRG